jgi:hypothetical protein
MSKKTRIYSILRSLPIPGLVLGCIFVAGSAQAVLPVIDPGHISTTYTSWLGQWSKEAAQWAKEGQRWMQQYQHMQQQLIQLQGFMSTSMPMTGDFKERDEIYGMEQCGGDGSTIDWSEVIAPDMNGDITDQQLKICQKTVLAKNKQYNETVRMLKKLRERGAEFKQIETRRGAVGSNQGKLEANDNDVSRFNTRMQMDLDYWQATMKAYDSYIVSMNQDQERLANQALKGPSRVFGTVMQGVALKAALKGARSRDR